jgi:hypothetical protein
VFRGWGASAMPRPSKAFSLVKMNLADACLIGVFGALGETYEL